MSKGVNVGVAGPPGFRRKATALLARPGYHLSFASPAASAGKLIARERPDVVIVASGSSARLDPGRVRALSPGTRVLEVYQRGARIRYGALLEADDFVLGPLDRSELAARIARLVAGAPRVGETGAVGVAGGALSPPWTDLQDPRTGRLDAGRIAAYLEVPLTDVARAIGKEYKAVFKTPSSRTIQEKLAPLHALLASLHQTFGSRRRTLAWLNASNAELEGARPIDLVLEGRAAIVLDLVEGALAGVTT